MEALIKQAFLHVDVIGQHVQEGHYDLTGPDGEIILPQVWDTMVKPDWEISMHMWPMPEPSAVAPSKEPEAVLPEAAGKKDKDKSAKAKRASAVIEPGVIVVPSAPPAGAHSIPPPPMHGLFPDPLGAAGAALPPGIVAVVEPEAAQAVSQKKSSKRAANPFHRLRRGSRGAAQGEERGRSKLQRRSWPALPSSIRGEDFVSYHICHKFWERVDVAVYLAEFYTHPFLPFKMA
ncbi:hypothetical protein H2203_001203 [Taxawa tesnikishii (nom. ined.)]|nr:hypothetical protein H2203_001203 [Dothideales sp. JES 119]